jgi:molybdopterin-guanine dinucleotide biosynthesis protein A
MTRVLLGAILAGGQSRRYGSPKALAMVGGQRIIDRAIHAVSEITPLVVLIANDPALASAVDLPSRADATAPAGALGGIWTALLWAEERGLPGVLAVACDMPFLSSALLRELVELATTPDATGRRPDAVLPESGGRREVEPLCACYSVRCIPAVQSALERDDHRMISFHADVRVVRMPLAAVLRHGQPEQLFLNVNTQAEREQAERVARGLA